MRLVGLGRATDLQRGGAGKHVPYFFTGHRSIWMGMYNECQSRTDRRMLRASGNQIDRSCVYVCVQRKQHLLPHQDGCFDFNPLLGIAFKWDTLCSDGVIRNKLTCHAVFRDKCRLKDSTVMRAKCVQLFEPTGRRVRVDVMVHCASLPRKPVLDRSVIKVLTQLIEFLPTYVTRQGAYIAVSNRLLGRLNGSVTFRANRPALSLEKIHATQ